MVSISNRFITWDLSTSDMTRDVNPGVEGIMQHLVLSPDNRYAAAFTTNNQVLDGINYSISETSPTGIRSSLLHFPLYRVLAVK